MNQLIEWSLVIWGEPTRTAVVLVSIAAVSAVLATGKVQRRFRRLLPASRFAGAHYFVRFFILLLLLAFSFRAYLAHSAWSTCCSSTMLRNLEQALASIRVWEVLAWFLFSTALLAQMFVLMVMALYLAKRASRELLGDVPFALATATSSFLVWVAAMGHVEENWRWGYRLCWIVLVLLWASSLWHRFLAGPTLKRIHLLLFALGTVASVAAPALFVYLNRFSDGGFEERNQGSITYSAALCLILLCWMIDVALSSRRTTAPVRAVRVPNSRE